MFGVKAPSSLLAVCVESKAVERYVTGSYCWKFLSVAANQEQDFPERLIGGGNNGNEQINCIVESFRWEELELQDFLVIFYDPSTTKTRLSCCRIMLSSFAN